MLFAAEKPQAPTLDLEQILLDSARTFLDLLSPLLRQFWWLWVILITLGVWRIARSAFAMRRLARSGISEIDAMDGLLFEKRMALLFRGLGYSVEQTRARGDYGADLVIEMGGARAVVQAKRWTKSVGVKAVQEAVAAKAMYRCSEAMVVTNSHFTPQARTLASANEVELWDRERLVEELLRGEVGALPAAATA
jgi:restriction system protein